MPSPISEGSQDSKRMHTRARADAGWRYSESWISKLPSCGLLPQSTPIRNSTEKRVPGTLKDLVEKQLHTAEELGQSSRRRLHRTPALTPASVRLATHKWLNHEDAETVLRNRRPGE